MAYKGNINLRGYADEIEYTEEYINQLKKCKKDPIYFIENYIKIIDVDDPESGYVNLKLREYQKNYILALHNNNRTMALWSRQSGKSVCSAAYILWYAIFNKQKRVALLAHQKSMAVEQLARIQDMFEQIPLWMQPYVRKWNINSIQLGNKSTIFANATQTKSARGLTINFLYLDEFAFVDSHIANAFISSVFPSISAIPDAKIVATSTPNGLNHYWELWDKYSVKPIETLEKNDFRCLKIAWNDVPGRDEKFREEQLELIGETKFLQEYACEFQGSISTLIDAKYIKCITTRKPNLLLDNRRFRIFSEALSERVLLDNGWQYIVTVDPAMGEKKDYTVAQVWLVKSNTDIEQVAVYESNDVDPHNFSNKLIGISKRYNTPGIIVETQEVGGGAIVENLFYTKNYPMLINLQDEGIGFRLSHNRKIEACAYLQVYMKKGLIKLCDDRTRFQLSMFGRKGNTYKALGDGNDDLVTSILSLLYYVNSDYYYGNRDNSSPFEKKDLIPDLNSDFENDALMIDELHKLEEEVTHRSAYVPTLYMSDMFKYTPNAHIDVYKGHA